MRMVFILLRSWRRCIRFVPCMIVLKSIRLHIRHLIVNLKFVRQILSRRFEHEKHKLQLNTGSKDLSAFAENSAACCSFTPVMLCEKSVFEAWQDTFLPVDYTSLFWDMKLLQKLTSIHLDDLEELHQVMLTTISYLFSPLDFLYSYTLVWLCMFHCLLKIAFYELFYC